MRIYQWIASHKNLLLFLVTLILAIRILPGPVLYSIDENYWAKKGQVILPPKIWLLVKADVTWQRERVYITEFEYEVFGGLIKTEVVAVSNSIVVASPFFIAIVLLSLIPPIEGKRPPKSS